MNKTDSSIAGRAAAKGTDGTEWLKHLRGGVGAALRADGENSGLAPDRNQQPVSLSAAPAEQPARQQAATASSAARSRGAVAGKVFSARRKS